MPRIAVLVSDRPDGALHQRAVALFKRLPTRFEPSIVCHDGGSLRRINTFLRQLRAQKPDLIYLLDPIYAAVVATHLHRITRRVPVVVDTGDLVYELAKEVRRLHAPALGVVHWSEQSALQMAKRVVVRSESHREWLAVRGIHRVSVIPDGVDLCSIFPTAERPWRERFGIRLDEVAVGGIGSMVWNTRHNTCFGWDLVEAMAHLRDAPVRGILFGDGDGLEHLQKRALALGVSERIVFAGRVAHPNLNDALNALDIALLTAPDSEVSQVRTTGKLPQYLASDRFVIATAVGTAGRLLAPLDMLLTYHGSGRDETYPQRLAHKVRTLLAAAPESIRLNGRGVALARAHFDYDRLASNLGALLDAIT